MLHCWGGNISWVEAPNRFESRIYQIFAFQFSILHFYSQMLSCPFLHFDAAESPLEKMHQPPQLWGVQLDDHMFEVKLKNELLVALKLLFFLTKWPEKQHGIL